MKSMWLLSGVLIGLLLYQVCDKWLQDERAKCLFFREGRCVKCADDFVWPVGYKENCACSNREAFYVDEGLFPAWQCVIKAEDEESSELDPIAIAKHPCPKHHPLRDILGNCYACDVKQPVRIAHGEKSFMCGKERYVVPDGLLDKSMKCPALSDIDDAEVCVLCGGIVWNGKCFREGENHFCESNEDCDKDEWCYPLRSVHNIFGVCTKKKENNWFCSGADGYDLASTEKICRRLGMHIPSLEEIETANEDLSVLCPTLDMWTFFVPDGVVWMQSFMQEFLFTREGESQNLGGHMFYALCHKD